VTVEPEAVTEVKAMLAAAGLVPTQSELSQIVTMYEGLKPRIEALYAVPEARYESPALVFAPRPKLGSWNQQR
jgi:hypothetical protein